MDTQNDIIGDQLTAAVGGMVVGLVIFMVGTVLLFYLTRSPANTGSSNQTKPVHAKPYVVSTDDRRHRHWTP